MSSRMNVRDTFSVWPSLAIELELAPWHWRIQWHNDWDMTSSWTLVVLFLKVEWSANRRLFPIERNET